MNAGVVAGIFQEMEEAAEQKRGTKYPDENMVPQKFQRGDVRKHIAEEPQPERQQRRHADDADRRVRQFAVPLFRENFLTEDADKDDRERFVTEEVEEVADHRGQEKSPAFCAGNCCVEDRRAAAFVHVRRNRSKEDAEQNHKRP